MQENLLDDYTADIEHPPIRTHRLYQLESVCLISFIFSFLYSIYNFISILLSIRQEEGWSTIGYGSWLIFWVGIGLSFLCILWWRNISIQYDNGKSLKFVLPAFLRTIRILVGIWLCYDFWQTISFLFFISMDVVSGNTGMTSNYLQIVLLQFFTSFIQLLFAYYLYYTHQIQKANS